MAHVRSHDSLFSATILCALQHEARSLRRALGDVTCEIHCCGPGSQAVEAWAARSGRHIAQDHPIILAGLAGSLREAFTAGSVHVISQVRDTSGSMVARAPPAHAEGANPSSAIVTSVEGIVSDGDQRAALAASSGADLVDLESLAFARIAHERGWRWGIVRGVSDDPSTALPAEVARWVAADGRTRPWAVARSLLRNPILLRDVLILQRHTRTALSACAAHLRVMLQRLAQGHDQKNP